MRAVRLLRLTPGSVLLEHTDHEYTDDDGTLRVHIPVVTNPDASTLSAAPPAAFGFLTARPAALTVDGSTLGPVPGTLGLVAGPVTISGATLRAPAGTIHVAGVAGAVALVPLSFSWLGLEHPLSIALGFGVTAWSRRR